MKKLFYLPILSVALSAAPLTVFNTGVGPTNVVLAAGATDSHYVGVTPASTVFVLGLTAGLPGTWIPNNSVSEWVGPDQADGTGTYSRIYRTTVDLTGFNFSTAVIAGRWATDNTGTDIQVNGTSTSQTSSAFASFTNFTLNSGFVAGINNIDFAWSNSGGPGGLRVEFTSAQATPLGGPIPEPGTIALMLGGVAALGFFRRK